MSSNILIGFLKNSSVLSRQSGIKCKIIQKPFQRFTPAVSLSSAVCGNRPRRSLKTSLKTPILQDKLHPSHLTLHRLQHFDPDKTTISIVDNIKVRHLVASIFKTLSNMIKFFYMQRFYDQKLQVSDFVKGAKAGISFVSTCLGENDTASLTEVMSQEALSDAEKSVQELDEDKQSLLKFSTEDILYFNILDIGIIEDGIKRFAEITTVALVKDKDQRVVPSSIRNFDQIKPENLNVIQAMQFIAAQDFVLVCTCRFIKEFTTGITDSWRVNKIHHTFVIPRRK